MSFFFDVHLKNFLKIQINNRTVIYSQHLLICGRAILLCSCDLYRKTVESVAINLNIAFSNDMLGRVVQRRGGSRSPWVLASFCSLTPISFSLFHTHIPSQFLSLSVNPNHPLSSQYGKLSPTLPSLFTRTYPLTPYTAIQKHRVGYLCESPGLNQRPQANVVSQSVISRLRLQDNVLRRHKSFRASRSLLLPLGLSEMAETNSAFLFLSPQFLPLKTSLCLCCSRSFNPVLTPSISYPRSES